MIWNAVGDTFADLTCDAMEVRLVCGVLGVSSADVVLVRILIVRSPLDTEKLHAKGQAPLRDAANDTLELFASCDDPDHI
jgi:hypothetical protein